MKDIIIYTDGATSGNGSDKSRGGFGVIVVQNEKIINAYSEYSKSTTNNREEMKAIIWALENYGKFSPMVFSDSAYSVNTFTNWMFSWQRKGWVKSDNKIPENLDLVQKYYALNQEGYKLDLRHIKGHAGHLFNELADKLATGKITSEEIIKTYGW